MSNTPSFKSLGLSPASLLAIERKGFLSPTPIQVKIIPLLLKGTSDIIGISSTGSGKTASFALPILEKMVKHPNHPRALVVVPTRELAKQVALEIASLKGDGEKEILTLYGGTAIGPQIKKIQKGVDFVVGTPGRLIDLIERGALSLTHLQYVVLDEADEMLKMGFLEDIEKILRVVPKERKTLLISATMPPAIQSLSKAYMNKRIIVDMGGEKAKELPPPNIEQSYIVVKSPDRSRALLNLLSQHFNAYTIIFCKTKRLVENTLEILLGEGYRAAAIHGDVPQMRRERVLKSFREQKIQVLVATDVAARGIDIAHLDLVINHSLPQDDDTYVHRIGRTGRAGRLGKAISLITRSEKKRIKYLDQATKGRLFEDFLPNKKELERAEAHRMMESIEKLSPEGMEKKYEAVAHLLLKKFSPIDAVTRLLFRQFEKKKKMDLFSGSEEKEKNREKNRKKNKKKDRKRDFRKNHRR